MCRAASNQLIKWQEVRSCMGGGDHQQQHQQQQQSSVMCPFSSTSLCTASSTCCACACASVSACECVHAGYTHAVLQSGVTVRSSSRTAIRSHNVDDDGKRGSRSGSETSIRFKCFLIRTEHQHGAHAFSLACIYGATHHGMFLGQPFELFSQRVDVCSRALASPVGLV